MKISLVPIVFLLSLGIVSADEFTDTFDALKKANDPLATEAFLEKAAVDEADNPNYYANAGNYWWGVAGLPSVSAIKEGDYELSTEDFSLTDPKTGKVVGAISKAGKTNPEIPKKALKILSEGAKKFPARADIAMGLAYIQKATGATDGYVETLCTLLAQAKKDPEALKWMQDKPLPEAAKTFLPESIQDYTVALFNANSPATDALCARLLEAVTDTFPDHPYAYNLKAALADANGKPDDALKFLETAHEKAPADILILSNLADIYAKSGQTEKSVTAYEALLKLKPDADLREKADAALKGLKGGN